MGAKYWEGACQYQCHLCIDIWKGSLHWGHEQEK
jgi:hypothetical protein